MSKKSTQTKVKSDTALSPQFGFAGFHVARVTFVEIEKQPLEPPAKSPLPVKAMFGLSYGVNESRAEVRLSASIRPDPRDKPYEIDIELVGRFVMREGNEAALEKFCRVGVPSILFPYLREIVHRLTIDGRYGVIRLDPVHFQSFVDHAGGWHPVKTSEPLPPSSQ